MRASNADVVHISRKCEFQGPQILPNSVGTFRAGPGELAKVVWLDRAPSVGWIKQDGSNRVIDAEIGAVSSRNAATN